MASIKIKSYTYGWDTNDHTGGIRLFNTNDNVIVTLTIIKPDEYMTILKILESGKSLIFNNNSKRIVSSQEIEL